MIDNDFVDYYELLQLSPNADTDTVDRIFRHLAKKTHPDSTEFPDNDRFQQIVEAHKTLADPETRAGYDAKYQDYWKHKWKIASEASGGSAFDNDIKTREKLLSLLYVQRRRDMKNPGLGELSVAKLLLTPPELLEFHLWYLKAQGWVERLDSGVFAITAQGVDQVEKNRLQLMPDHLLEEHYASNGLAEENGEPDIEKELFYSEDTENLSQNN
ncbi:MAG: DnaJ domain-containing protein [Geobacteraceae bacterium]